MSATHDQEDEQPHRGLRLVRADSREATVSPLELFFDLVSGIGSLGWPRIVAAALCLALIPAAMQTSGAGILAILLAIWIALIAYEAVRHAEVRARVRAERIGH